MPSVVVFYISGHGFGHASRDIEVVNALLDRRPDVHVIVRSAAKRWLFDLTVRHPIEFQPFEADTGVVQIDSLRLDEAETIRRAGAFHRDLEAKAAAEAERLSRCGAVLVVGDAPPLAFAAASVAGVPSILLGNFTWDWIYEAYAAELAGAPGLVPLIRDAYRRADTVLRLPMWGGFASIDPARIVDLPLVARRSRRAGAEVRRALGLPPGERLVLLSFGGFGLNDFDLASLAHLPGWRVVSTGHVGARARSGDAGGSIIEIDEHELYGAGFRYEDLVVACDVVATKPGYGIIAECAANGAGLLYTSRGKFVEYDVLVEWMPRLVRSRFIPQDEFQAGRWAPHLEAIASETPPPRPRVDGAEVAAELLIERLGSHT